MYHVMPQMRNANFIHKYGDFGTPQYIWNGYVIGRNVHYVTVCWLVAPHAEHSLVVIAVPPPNNVHASLETAAVSTSLSW